MRYLDSILVVIAALSEFLNGNKLFNAPHNERGVCGIGKAEPWDLGDKFLRNILDVQTDGTMNYLNFSDDNHVWSTNFDIVNLCDKKWSKVGAWSVDSNGEPSLVMETKPYFPGNTKKEPVDVVANFNVTLEITTIIEEPFIKPNPDYPNDASKPFVGYCIDMLDEIKKLVGFHYNIRLVQDGFYGALDPKTKKWNGMIRELIDKEADMSVSALIITAERNKYVDFSKPFMDMGLDILMAKETADADIFYFFRPFSWTLWMSVVGATVLCGIVIALCSFLSPQGWRGRYIQRRRDTDHSHRLTKSKLNYHNASWFAIASVMHGGLEVSPRSFSGRVVAGAWWAAVTIICASYTANLAAFLTVARLDTGIKTLDDLSEQTDVKYGTIDGTAIQTFFREQTMAPYPRMYNFMVEMDAWVKDSIEGEQKVRDSYAIPKGKKGKYAYIYDSTVLDYIARQPPCHTRTLKQLFKKSGYGIAFRKNSPYVQIFDNAILKLREKGIMETIEKHWISGICPDPDSDSGETTGGEQLNLEQMAGIFIVFAIGIGLGLICMMFEYLFAASTDAFNDSVEMGKSGRTCFHLGRRLRASTSDLAQQFCVCCGKSRRDHTEDFPNTPDINLDFCNSENKKGKNFTYSNGSNRDNYITERKNSSLGMPSGYEFEFEKKLNHNGCALSKTRRPGSHANSPVPARSGREEKVDFRFRYMSSDNGCYINDATTWGGSFK